MLIHSVYFWLNDDAPADEAKKLAESCTALVARSRRPPSLGGRTGGHTATGCH